MFALVFAISNWQYLVAGYAIRMIIEIYSLWKETRSERVNSGITGNSYIRVYSKKELAEINKRLIKTDKQ